MTSSFEVPRIRNVRPVFVLLCPLVLCVAPFVLASQYESDQHTPPTPKWEHVKDADEQRVRDFISDHEHPRQIPVRVQIQGDLATPASQSNIKLPFVPKQTYVQVRRYDKEIHLPRSAAFAEARTDEEILNAPRLREIVSHTKKQEVYEEQGYEDAAYDHGGYKKAAEKHEKKIIPSQVNKLRPPTVDQLPDQAQIHPLRRRNATDSSHDEIASTQPSSTRRPKRPKLRHSWPRTSSRDRSPHHDSAPSDDDDRIPTRRRRLKTKPTTESIPEETNIFTTRSAITDVDIKPTTYHPPSSKFLTTKARKIFTSTIPVRIFKIPKLSEQGYKFEDPFKDFSEIIEISSLPRPSLAAAKNIPLEIPFAKPPKFINDMYDGETRDFNAIRTKPKSEFKYRHKNKNLPYKLEQKKYRPEKKRVKPTFPYRIITYPEEHRFGKNEKKSFSIFGPPDDSPWIPLTPKDVYEIHGLKSHSSTQAQGSENKERKLAPIRVFEPQRIVSTSYSIQHVYNPEKQPSKANNKASDTVQPTSEKDIVNSSTPSTATKNNQNDDIITAHSSDIRILLKENLKNRSASAFASTTPDPFEEKDLIETLSSNRYTIFQRANYTTPVVESSTSSVNDEFNRLFLDEQKKFLFRHPHLSRETSRFIKPHPDAQPVHNSTSQPDTISSSQNITHTTRVSKRNDNYVQPVLIYPEDYSNSAKFVEKLTLAQFSSPQTGRPHPSRVIDLKHHNRNRTSDERFKRETWDENEELVSISLGSSTTQIPVNVKKYPFYKITPSKGLSKYSVLRYISNPKDIPVKEYGKMSFYESRNRQIECEEPQPPEKIIPIREEGEWGYNPEPQLPRIKLGDKISCLKVKFFGEDPLDNPFFKENSISFPKIFPKPQRHRDEVETSETREYEVRPNQRLRLRMKSRKPKEKSRRQKRQIGKVSESSTNEKLGKKQEIFFVGGFLNRANTKNSDSEGSHYKLVPQSTNDTFESIKNFNNEFAFIPESVEADFEVEEDAALMSEAFREINKIKPNSLVPKTPAVSHSWASSNMKPTKTKKYRRFSTKHKMPYTSKINLQTKKPDWRNEKIQEVLMYITDPNTGNGKWVNDGTSSKNTDSAKHIRNLMKNVARLKASQVEINNLMDTSNIQIVSNLNDA